MTAIAALAREHYAGTGLLDRVRAALAALGPEAAPLTVEQLAAMDQFHTRGLAATRDLARSAGLEPGMAVLDLGCGIGGPARVLAATYGVHVTGVDLSDAFVETATYLSARCGLSDQTVFLAGDALAPPVRQVSFDRVFLQHVAMNIADRAALYDATHRVLKPGGRLAGYDIVARGGDVHFPVPWTRTQGASHLLTADETRTALSAAGFTVERWQDDTDVATQWFAARQAAEPPPGPSLATVLGADFRSMAGNLARNLREGRAGVLSFVARR